MTQGNRNREKMLDGLAKWLKVGRVTDALKTTKDRDDHDCLVKSTAHD